MASLSLGGMQLLRACARVDDGGFYDDTTLFDELFNVCARVCVSDF